MLRTSLFVGAAAAVLLAWHPLARAQPRGFGTLSVTGQDRNHGDLALESLGVEVTVEGAAVRTEVTHVFRSALSRDVEGVFRMRLPEGAAVVRLAMDVAGTMMEGELVEAARARAIYDEIVRARIDPALLEDKGDGRYELSIFPVPAGGTKTVVLTYEQLAGERYRYPLPRLGSGDRAIGRFAFRLTADGKELHRVRRRRFRPRRSIELALPSPAQPVRIESTPRGAFAMVTLRVTVPDDAPPERVATTVVAVDTSHSMAVGFARTRAAARGILREAARAGQRVALVHGDVRAQSCGHAAVEDCLAKLDTGGGSDLGGLLALALAEAGRLGGPARVLLVSDGVPSLGARSHAALAGAIAEHAGTLDVAVHALAAGSNPAIDTLAAIARAGGGALHCEGSARAIVEALVAARITELAVSGGGLNDVALLDRDNVLPGAPVRLVARLGTAVGRLRLRGRYRGRPATVSTSVDPARATTGAMVERFWARSYITERIARGAPDREIVTLSLRHGVMSPHTSFLVLETDGDYRRRGIARTTSERNARELGAIEGATTRGSGHLRRRRVARPPAIRIAQSPVMGSLDRDMIRRPINRSRNQLRHCYERALLPQPGLRGRVVLRWTIDDTGAVAEVGIESSELGHPEMERCLVDVARTWRYPAVRHGGVIHVRYPLSFDRPTAARGGSAARISVPERRRALERYLTSGMTARADRHYRASVVAIDPDGTRPDRLLPLFADERVRARFAADFRRAALARLARPYPPGELVEQLFESYLGDNPAAIPAAFAGQIVSVARARRMLDRLIHRRRPQLAARLVAAWRARGSFDDDALQRILLHGGAATGALAPELYAVASRLVAGGDLDAMDSLVGAGLEVGAHRAVAARVVRQCRSPEDDHQERRCDGWLRQTIASPAVRRLVEARVARLVEARRRAPGDPEISAALASAFDTLGRRRLAERARSEIVEAAPDDPEAHAAYQRALQE